MELLRSALALRESIFAGLANEVYSQPLLPVNGPGPSSAVRV